MSPGEIASNIIAIAALLISLYGFYREKRSEKKSHEFDLFVDVYKDHLVSKIPSARAEIHITQAGEITGIDSLISALNSIRKDSIYFKYAEPQFYEELKKTLWDLEDYLTMIEEPFVGEARVNFDYEVNSRLSNIYKCLLKKF